MTILKNKITTRKVLLSFLAVFVFLLMSAILSNNSKILHSASSTFSVLGALNSLNQNSLDSNSNKTAVTPFVLNPAGDRLILNRPMGLNFTMTGELYVADLLNKRLRFFKKGKQFPEAGKIESSFLLPWSLDLDLKSNIYVSDTGKNQIISITNAGEVKYIGTKGKRPGTFNIPTGICIDEPRQRLLVADFANHVVQILSLDGTFLGHIGGTTSSGLFGKPGRLEGEFRGPSDVDVDSFGRIYVADKENSRIQIFHSGGNFITTFGQAGAAKGRFNKPSGLCVDHNGDIYICDTFNNRIQIIKSPFATAMKPQYKVIKVLTTDQYTTGAMKVPNKCAIANDGTLYVADTGNNRIIAFPKSLLKG